MCKYLIYEVREVLRFSILSTQHLGGLNTCRQWASWYSSLSRVGLKRVLPVAHELLNLWFALGRGSLALWYWRWPHQAGQREQRSPTIVNAV